MARPLARTALRSIVIASFWVLFHFKRHQLQQRSVMRRFPSQPQSEEINAAYPKKNLHWIPLIQDHEWFNNLIAKRLQSGKIDLNSFRSTTTAALHVSKQIPQKYKTIQLVSSNIQINKIQFHQNFPRFSCPAVNRCGNAANASNCINLNELYCFYAF